MKTKKVDNKQKMTVLLALVLVAALAIGGTLAYLTAKTEEKENKFTFATAGEDSDKNMKVDIWEPLWDGEYPEEYEESQIPDDEEEWGIKRAVDVVPGRVIPKDPLLENTSDKEIDEWVAMTVEFWTNGTAGDGSDAVALTQAQIDYLFGAADGYVNLIYDTVDWEFSHFYEDDESDAIVGVYIYKSIVKASEITEPLFEKVEIDIEAPNSYIDPIAAYGGFNIRLNGYAIQAENVTYAQAKTLFGDLGDGTNDIFLDNNR